MVTGWMNFAFNKPHDHWAAWLEHLAAGNAPFGPPFMANIHEVVEGYQAVIADLQKSASTATDATSPRRGERDGQGGIHHPTGDTPTPEPSHKWCPSCDGARRIKTEGGYVLCADCDGDGYVESKGQ